MGKVPSGLCQLCPHHSSSQASLLPLAGLAPLACLLHTVQRTGFSEVSLAWDSSHGPRQRPAQLLHPLFPVRTRMFSLPWAVYSFKLPAGGRWRLCLQEPWPQSVSGNGQKPPGGGDGTRALCVSVELGWALLLTQPQCPQVRERGSSLFPCSSSLACLGDSGQDAVQRRVWYPPVGLRSSGRWSGRPWTTSPSGGRWGCLTQPKARPGVFPLGRQIFVVEVSKREYSRSLPLGLNLRSIWKSAGQSLCSTRRRGHRVPLPASRSAWLQRASV